MAGYHPARHRGQHAPRACSVGRRGDNQPACSVGRRGLASQGESANCCRSRRLVRVSVRVRVRVGVRVRVRVRVRVGVGVGVSVSLAVGGGGGSAAQHTEQVLLLRRGEGAAGPQSLLEGALSGHLVGALRSQLGLGFGSEAWGSVRVKMNLLGGGAPPVGCLAPSRRHWVRLGQRPGQAPGPGGPGWSQARFKPRFCPRPQP